MIFSNADTVGTDDYGFVRFDCDWLHPEQGFNLGTAVYFVDNDGGTNYNIILAILGLKLWICWFDRESRSKFLAWRDQMVSGLKDRVRDTIRQELGDVTVRFSDDVNIEED